MLGDFWFVLWVGRGRIGGICLVYLDIPKGYSNFVLTKEDSCMEL